MSILLLIFYFNKSEVILLVESYFPWVSLFTTLSENISLLLPVAGAITTIILGICFCKGVMDIHSIFKELYTIVIIGVSFSVMPLFVGFTLYFVLLHSLKVMVQEFDYCKEQLYLKDHLEFIKLLLPLSFISVIGTVLIIGSLIWMERSMYIPFVLLVVISCITIPHTIIMQQFYLKLNNNN